MEKNKQRGEGKGIKDLEFSVEKYKINSLE